MVPLLLAPSLTAGPARAEICPDGTEAEFCLPPETPPTSGSRPAREEAAAPPPPVLVDVYRLDARLLPLGAALGWQTFSRELLDTLPQEVRRESPAADPDPQASASSSFRFSPQPRAAYASLGWQPFSPDLLEPLPQLTRLNSGFALADPKGTIASGFRFSREPRNYYSARDGWRLRVFGQGFGGPLVKGASGGPSSFSAAQIGLRLDYASGDLLIGAFGRFGQLWTQGGSLDTLGTSFGARSTRATLGGGGLLLQLNKPGWFVGAAVGGDGLTADQPFAIRSTNAFGIRTSTPGVGGSAFNVATQLGGRIRLSQSQFLEPSALLTLTRVSLGGVTIFDAPTGNLWNVPGSSSTLGTADLGITWRAPIREGRNLLVPSLRLSWLSAGFLGGAPSSSVGNGLGLAATQPAGALIQGSGLGLQGSLAYTLRDNTTFYVRGGAGFYGGGTAWDVGGGVQLRWGGAPRRSRPLPAS
ncbi:MAG: hypothetical protein ER33_15675 [Cyanobium sp. CACIAM 14]|nr:MAG: hypothetical protein ER33_15675 [Cyanobium sp. CACIAM 14]